MTSPAGAMARDFADRDMLVAYVQQEFPASESVDGHVAGQRGGRKAALAALALVDPAAYARTRNHLDGAVTRLSPYVRHGVLSLAEVRDAVLGRVRDPHEAARLLTELGWRDYFQRVYAALGDGIWRDQEPNKTGWRAEEYAGQLPDDVAQGTTGLACIDGFSAELRATGYLHNHARMWLAAYIVHFRRVRWQAGARWFLSHLLDGDPASNNLSWQWVASTFSHKPYIFNRANLEKYAGSAYCQSCPLRAGCPLDDSYEALAARLFPRMSGGEAVDSGPLPAVDGEHGTATAQVHGQTVVWVHGDMLSPRSVALQAQPGAPAIWVWDDELLAAQRISLKRIVFLYECLLELPVVIRRGDVAAEVLDFARAAGARTIVTAASPSPRFATIRRLLEQEMPVAVLHESPFAAAPRALDLRRFSRYWRKVERSVLPQSGARRDV